MTTTRPFPLALSAATIVTTSLALSAAALNIQWSAAPHAGEALHSTWLYVNIMLTITIFIIWPTLTLNHHPTQNPDPNLNLNPNPNPIPPSPHELLWQLTTLLTAAFPALLIAHFLSNPTATETLSTLTLQLSFGLFTLGILSFAYPRRPLHAPAMALLATLTLALPIAAFLFAEFLPLAPVAWQLAIPEIAIATPLAAAPYAIPAYSLLGLFAITLAWKRNRKSI